jgi:hypothetical protein
MFRMEQQTTPPKIYTKKSRTHDLQTGVSERGFENAMKRTN